MVRFHPWMKMHRVNGTSSMIHDMQRGVLSLMDNILEGDKLSQKMDTLSSSVEQVHAMGISWINSVSKKAVRLMFDRLCNGCHLLVVATSPLHYETDPHLIPCQPNSGKVICPHVGY